MTRGTPEPPSPRRGDVYWLELSGAVGSEIKKTRPAIVISNDVANRVSPRIQLIPLTTAKPTRVVPTDALVRIGAGNSRALTDQIVTADKRRLGERMTTLSDDDLAQVEHALCIQLGINLRRIGGRTDA